MINIRNYFKSFLVTVLMLAVVWFVSLQLTKQRIALEAENKFNSIDSLQTPFVWSFNFFNEDVVESFQRYWQNNADKQQIYAKAASNPHLSLNFSGQSLSAQLHEKLLIYFKAKWQGNLKIQAKVDELDSVYYYLETVTSFTAFNSSQAIEEVDFSGVWNKFSASGENLGSAEWGKDIAKITSLVLIFDNPSQAVEISKIVVPYNQTELNISQADVNCSGQVSSVKTGDFMQFNLNENCLLPSNYMWLKQKLEKQFPESILLLDDVKSWQKPGFHQVNRSYSSNSLLNALLYALLAICFAVVFWQRKMNSEHKQAVSQQPWYKWAAKQMLFKGVKTAIKPRHLLINYVVVLVPTAALLLIMASLHFPELQAFKKLPLYILWALIQQFFLGYVFAERIFYNKTQNRLISALLAAAVFSLLHAPSVTLMLSTFVVGGLWAYAFLVFKRLLPLALSHAILALMFYHVVSDRVLYTAKVMQWFWE